MREPTNCDNCGACCMGQNLLPACCNRHIPTPELDRLVTIFDGPCEGGDEVCIWLDRYTGRCLHYEWRPELCRKFEVGGEACLRIRENAGMEL